jgi:hypothetical protein
MSALMERKWRPEAKQSIAEGHQGAAAPGGRRVLTEGIEAGDRYVYGDSYSYVGGIGGYRYATLKEIKKAGKDESVLLGFEGIDGQKGEDQTIPLWIFKDLLRRGVYKLVA